MITEPTDVIKLDMKHFKFNDQSCDDDTIYFGNGVFDTAINPEIILKLCDSKKGASGGFSN